MRVIHGAGAVDGAFAVSIGAYDGVHLGHRRLLEHLRRSAAALGCGSAVVTFDRHPATVIRPDSAPRLLTDLDQKLELLASAGIDLALVVDFDGARARESAEDFVRTVLVDQLHARAVVVGQDFHFGRDRLGNVELLRRMGVDHGFEVAGVELLGAGDRSLPVSSTRIRGLLAAGEVGAAAELLGRPHQVRGRVEHGDGRGRQLGFPTANVSVPAAIAVAADGVYAGWYEGPDGLRRAAAVSIGRRPTFYQRSRLSLLEVYVLDFAGDLYDQPARVELVARLRAQERYDTVDALVAQMHADVAATRQHLS